MSNSDIEQAGTVKGHIPNGASLSGRISNVVSLSGHISIGGGASDFIIKMTVARNDDGNYTVTSCDTTVEQIDAAVAAEKRVVVIASDGIAIFELPMIQGIQGQLCIFGTFLGGKVILSSVYKGDEGGSYWEFVATSIHASNVDYSNAALPNISTVGGALDELVFKSHSHTNKSVLDKFSETDGKPTYDGEALGGGGASDFIIRMTIEVDGDNYTVTSCDKTMEQIDAAVASGQNIKAIAFDKFIMPMTQIMEYGESYTFGAFLGMSLVVANVYKNPESGTDEWEFYLIPLTADTVEYSNDAMPRISTVGDALNELVPKSHSHTNKSVLDKFTETDGKPTYDGEALGSDFIIKMNVTIDDNGNYTVTSCDTTVEQIDAAVANEKRVVLIATDTDNNLSWDIPIVQGFNGSNYYFATFLLGQAILSFVEKIGENQARWQFVVRQIGSEFISYSNDALPNVTDVESALNELVPNSHTHSNKSVLDKFAESDGKPTYNGEALGGGASDFIIKMTVARNDGEIYTVTSCDATFEQIDAAVAAEKRVVVIATDNDNAVYELPMISGVPNVSYMFSLFLSGFSIVSTIYKNDEGGSYWEFVTESVSAYNVYYQTSALPNTSTVADALDKLVTKKVIKGTNITLADNTEYRLTDVTTLTLTYPTGNFECWMRMTFAASGDATVTLPTGTKYIGTTPDFKNGETWEMSIKDGVVIAQKVGDGT